MSKLLYTTKNFYIKINFDRSVSDIKYRNKLRRICLRDLEFVNCVFDTVYLVEMTTQRAYPQSKEALLKSYMTRLKDDVKSILVNYEGKS